MKITESGNNKLQLLDIDGKLVSKNFAGAKRPWDVFNDGDGTDRKFRIKLSQEEAEYFKSIGAKMIEFAANPPEYPDPAWFLEIRVSYKNCTKPNPGQGWSIFNNGPKVVMITDGVPSQLMQEDIYMIDERILKNIDCEVRISPVKLKTGERVIRNGVPGVNLWAQRVYATVEASTDELDKRYENIPAAAAVTDDEDYEKLMNM